MIAFMIAFFLCEGCSMSGCIDLLNYLVPMLYVNM